MRSNSRRRLIVLRRPAGATVLTRLPRQETQQAVSSQCAIFSDYHCTRKSVAPGDRLTPTTRRAIPLERRRVVAWLSPDSLVGVDCLDGTISACTLENAARLVGQLCCPTRRYVTVTSSRSSLLHPSLRVWPFVPPCLLQLQGLRTDHSACTRHGADSPSGPIA